MPDHEVLPAFADSVLPHVGTYRRVLPVTLERLYENALDWEHLPYVHQSSFSAIRCQASGHWGWRAEVASPRGTVSVIELKLDRSCRRWITRTLQGSNKGAEIWTNAFAVGADRVDIVVDFFVPGVDAAARDKVGGVYAALYSQLYDEDVAMMVDRQRHLDRKVGGSRREERVLNLGSRGQLRLPQTQVFAGREYVIAEAAGEILAYPARCPHQLGPLADAPMVAGVVTCPWHGYRFDVRTGECVSGQNCRLGQMPMVEQRNGDIILRRCFSSACTNRTHVC